MATAVRKLHNQATNGGRDLFYLKLVVHHPRKSGKESEAGVAAEATEECHLLACS